MEIKRTKKFDHSYKKMLKKHYPVELIQKGLIAIAENNNNILLKIKDHSLSNNWKGYRAFHPGRLSNKNHKTLDNWIVIYKISDNKLILTLVDTGQHKIL